MSSIVLILDIVSGYCASRGAGQMRGWAATVPWELGVIVLGERPSE